MAKKSITFDLHGTKWKVHQDLADSPGLRFAQEYFSGYDGSQVEWVTVKVGEWGIPTGGLDENGGWTNAVAGKCQYPKKRGLKYRLNVRVNDRNGWPKPVYQRMSPIYVPVGDDLDYLGDQYDQAVEGQVPEDCILRGSNAYGDVYLNADETKMWKRMIRLFWLTDEDEALVYIIAHEAFHYLRRTRQIDGKNVEIEADRYAEGVLRAFQALEEYGGLARPDP
jgi:hypothetical protein